MVQSTERDLPRVHNPESEDRPEAEKTGISHVTVPPWETRGSRSDVRGEDLLIPFLILADYACQDCAIWDAWLNISGSPAFGRYLVVIDVSRTSLSLGAHLEDHTRLPMVVCRMCHACRPKTSLSVTAC